MQTNGTVIDAWRRRVDGHPDAPALAWFDAVLTAGEVDDLSDGIAAALADRGVVRGDRVALHLQNVPHYALLFLAIWKLGAAAVLVNPMYRGRELRVLLDDAEPVLLVCADHDADALLAECRDTTVRGVLSVNARDFQTRDDERVFTRPASEPRDDDLLTALAPGRPNGPDPASEEVALLAYTSGTTGPPKGAMVSHANLLATATDFGDRARVRDGAVVFAAAPLFHITGAVLNAAVALVRDTTLAFAGRFDAGVTLDALVEHRVTYTIGSITVFNALSAHPNATRSHFDSLETVYSGGAPIPPATVAAFEERFGHYIHNAYGMTETTAGVIAVPPGERAPVDPGSGSLAVGRPLPRAQVSTVDDSGNPTLPGVPGELEVGGPQVVSGYWGKPDATSSAMPDGRMRTGDVAVIDADGWVYLVDRLKDQINVSGYKVWPREVEDVLYEHPAVFEAAVVGRPDDYQGESVFAYVSLRADVAATGDELVEFARSRLAAYKRPRTVHVVTDLPKTLTGKIRRAALADRALPTRTGSESS
ncbi:class I adenylate-forming enzyme family protein [Rhodococcoides kroppenstedtii]|uniref:class I adenylate-forming enzyme family protein n=1 Tax=Rhodococcoides kroppenstedtii TaxID=293050 RepID=UPI001BDE7711|nr:AMP-binding protein [Rhodococcus kroppenstedtii]MBT1193516.1 AMP-binding protein [Rhodococcus kroppenstedtii]